MLVRRLSSAVANGARRSSFDYIIVGAGSAGCVLANRLSSDPANRVLLIEAGGEHGALSLKMPAMMLHNLKSTRHNWAFQGEAEPGLGGRSLVLIAQHLAVWSYERLHLFEDAVRLARQQGSGRSLFRQSVGSLNRSRAKTYAARQQFPKRRRRPASLAPST